MKITATLPDHGVIVEAVLEGFVLAAMEMIAAGVVPPSPLDTPVKYAEEAGGEEWLLPNQVMQRGRGDCEDLCIWYAAGLRVTGQDPGAACILAMTGPKKIHCLVLSGGRTIDPSLILKQRAAQYGRADMFAVSGDVRVTDHRGQPNPVAKKPVNAQPAAAPADGGTKSTPQNDPLYYITQYLKQNPGYKNRDASGDKSGATFTDSWQQENGGDVNAKLWERRAQQPEFISAMQGLANASAVGDTISATFGKGKRSTVPGENMVLVDAGDGTQFWTRQGINDPLAEFGQDPQAPWGGGYGADFGYGGDFGYYGGGYGFGDSYGSSGFGPAPWQDSPLLTYADLYAGDIQEPDEFWPYGGDNQDFGAGDQDLWEEM